MIGEMHELMGMCFASLPWNETLQTSYHIPFQNWVYQVINQYNQSDSETFQFYRTFADMKFRNMFSLFFF